MSKPLIVRALQPAEYKRWDNFVKACPSATFFHMSGWKVVIDEILGHSTYYLVAEEAGTLVGILPLVHVSSGLFGDALISTAFSVGGGIVAFSERVQVVLSDAAKDLASVLQADFLEYRYVQNVPSILNDLGVIKDLYYRFVLMLPSDTSDLLSSIPRKQRAVIRKARKEQHLEVKSDADVDSFYHCYSVGQRNLGTPVHAYQFYERLKKVFSDECRVLTAYDSSSGRPVASVFVFYFGGAVLPYYAGGNHYARHLKAFDRLYWELMCDAINQGYTRFDFGRSKINTGAFHYKRHWGIEPQPMQYRYFLNSAKQIPETNPTNPKYRFMIKAWKRLPLRVSQMLGPIIARQIG